MAKDKTAPPPMVRVRVMRAIAFGGVAIRPEIDDSGRSKGAPAIVKPVVGTMPADLAQRTGARYVEVLGPAPPGEKPGRVPKAQLDAEDAEAARQKQKQAETPADKQAVPEKKK